MKRFPVFLIAFISAFVLIGCSSNKISDNTVEEIPETIEEADEPVVKAYSDMNFSELEVLSYEGDARAMFLIGQMYEYGLSDVNQDFEKAFEWYEKASQMDEEDAICALGYFYLTGTSVEIDKSIAEELFLKAMDLGSVNAKVGYARTLIELRDADNPSEEDDALISELVRSAARAGDVDALYYLGYMYEHGIGVEEDLELAVGQYKRAAESVSDEVIYQYAINNARVSLGLIYMGVNQTTVEADPEIALSYFESAASNQFPKAMFYCGQMYENGVGVDVDYEKAMDYYLDSANLDYAPALNQIGYLYFNGYGVDVNYSSTVYYQKMAALQGYAPAQANLGYLYENGYGVERNLETALSYYDMASASGFEGAEEAAQRVRAQLNEEI